MTEGVDMQNVFLELLKWYHSQCNGSWEYDHGISIKTTSKPGWVVYISITDTELQFKPSIQTSIQKDETDWIECIVHNGFFIAHCGVTNLLQVLKMFLQWDTKILTDDADLNEDLTWLSYWFRKMCNGSWEYHYGINLRTIDNPGWTFDVNLQETAYSERSFEPVITERSDNDWLHVFQKETTFKSACGPLNLIEVLNIFRDRIGEDKGLFKTEHKPIRWAMEKRFDGVGKCHLDKASDAWIETPHIHDPSYPGGVRAPFPFEIPS